MADLSMSLTARTKGTWRFRVAGYLFGLAGRVLSGYRVEMRVGDGPWQDITPTVHVDVTVAPTT